MVLLLFSVRALPQPPHLTGQVYFSPFWVGHHSNLLLELVDGVLLLVFRHVLPVLNDFFSFVQSFDKLSK